MRLRTTIPAGLVDAALAALATFAMGLYAARELSADLLGVYALFFASFVLVTKIPRNLVFLPAEVAAVESDDRGPARLGVMRPAIKMAIAPALIASALGAAAASMLSGSAAADVVFPLAITMFACGVLQPVETHVRRMLHVAGSSWHAPWASGAQFVVVVASLVALAAVDVATPWIPFGAFALGLAASITLGLILENRLRPPVALAPIAFARIYRSGSQLVLADLFPSLAAFVGSALVLQLAGADVLGFTEAARVVSRPVGVFAVGLLAPMQPQAVDAAIRQNRDKGRRVTRIFLFLLTGVGIAYLAYAGFDWPGNLMTSVVPKAYEVEGLVAVAIVSAAAQNIAGSHRAQLLGARRERSLILVEVVGNSVRLLFAAASPVLRSFALPLGMIALGTVRLVGQGMVTRKIYPQR